MQLLTEMKKLLSMGFQIFPLHGIKEGKCTCSVAECNSAGKHPIMGGWQDLAEHPDPVKWAQAYPYANIGISTQNLVVIDVDDITCDLAQEILPLLPATLSARTGRASGMHRYYRASVPHKLTVHALGGLDIRARGGLVVAPPSMHKTGVRYEWVNPDDPVAELPENLIRLLEQKVTHFKKALFTRPEKVGKIPVGQRHDYLRDEIFRRVVRNMQRQELETVIDKYLLCNIECPEDVSPQKITSLIEGAYRKKEEFKGYDFTEAGVGEKFVQFWRDELVFLESGEWLQHSGGTWKRITQPENLFKPVREVLYRVNMEHAREDMVDVIHKFWRTSGSWRFAESVIKFAKPELTVKVSEFICPPDTLPFQNGLYDLVSGEFRAFRGSDHIVDTLLCPYDPGATADKWEATFNYVTGGDPEIVRFLQQCFGYFCSTRTMRGVFFLVGPKSAGKTTLITTLADILGERYASTAQLGLIHSTRSFSEDEDMARACVALVGRRFVFMDEPNKNAIIDPAKFKRIASNDAVLTARHLRHDAFAFVNKAKVVILTNNQPQIDVEDDAAWDRVLYLPFLVSIDKKDRRDGFKNELLSEASGIMNWCIAGFRDYDQHGFVVPQGVINQVAEWQLEDNPLAQFIEERCILDPSVQYNASALWDIYESWRVNVGYGISEGHIKSPGLFTKNVLRLLGDKVETTKSNGKRFIRGISLK